MNFLLSTHWKKKSNSWKDIKLIYLIKVNCYIVLHVSCTCMTNFWKPCFFFKFWISTLYMNLCVMWECFSSPQQKASPGDGDSQLIWPKLYKASVVKEDSNLFNKWTVMYFSRRIYLGQTCSDMFIAYRNALYSCYTDKISKSEFHLFHMKSTFDNFACSLLASCYLMCNFVKSMDVCILFRWMLISLSFSSWTFSL